MAKTKTTPPEVLALKTQYEQAGAELWKKVAAAQMGGKASQFYEDMAKAADAQVAALDEFTTKWAGTLVVGNHAKAKKAVLEAVQQEVVPLSSIAVNPKAAAIVAENIADTFTQANHFAGRRFLDVVREATLQSIGQKTLQGLTLRETKALILEQFTKSGVLVIADRRGRSIPLPAYAEMVARSTYAEIVNTATVDEMVEVGGDLVQMSDHASTCPICALYEGRVYSINGKTKGYPRLEKVFSGGYANIHPNCIHTLTPYFREFDDNADELQAFSARPFEQDEYTRKAVAGYRQQQAAKSGLNRDRKQWQHMRSVLGEAAPKTLSAFRAIKKAHGQHWDDLVGKMYARGAKLNPPGIKLAPAAGPVSPLAGVWKPTKPPKAEYMTKKKKAALAAAQAKREARSRAAAGALAREGTPLPDALDPVALERALQKVRADAKIRALALEKAKGDELQKRLALVAGEYGGSAADWKAYAAGYYRANGAEKTRRHISDIEDKVAALKTKYADQFAVGGFDWESDEGKKILSAYLYGATGTSPSPMVLDMMVDSAKTGAGAGDIFVKGKLALRSAIDGVSDDPKLAFLAMQRVTDNDILDVLDPGWSKGHHAFGGVLFDDEGRVLLREPTNHYGGYVWTWPKGQPEPGLSVAKVALKEVGEETGYVMDIVGALPGEYAGSTSSTACFFVGKAGGYNKALMDAETQNTKWFTIDEAREAIKKSSSVEGVKRDLAILDDAAAWWNEGMGGPKHKAFSTALAKAQAEIQSPAFKAKKAAALQQTFQKSETQWKAAFEQQFIAKTGVAPTPAIVNNAKTTIITGLKPEQAIKALDLKTDAIAKAIAAGPVPTLPEQVAISRAQKSVGADLQAWIASQNNVVFAQDLYDKISPVVLAKAEAAGVDIPRLLMGHPGGVVKKKLPASMVASEKTKMINKYGPGVAKAPAPAAGMTYSEAFSALNDLSTANPGVSINTLAGKFTQDMKNAFAAEGKSPAQIAGTLKAFGHKGSISAKNGWGAPGVAVPKAPKKVPVPKVKLPDAGDLDYVGDGARLGGAGRKSIYKDAAGNQYLFKPAFEKGGGAPALYKAQAQESAARVQMIVGGSKAIPIKTMRLGGEMGTLQPLVTLGSDQNVLADWAASAKVKLSKAQIAQLQREHVTDWLVGNFDSHGKNFVMADNGDILGVDKEQAFRWIGYSASRSMSYTYHPNQIYGENPPIYNTLFSRFAKNQVDLDTSETLKYIKKVEAIGDSEYREMWRGYAEALHGPGKSAEDLLDMIMERKQGLRSEYETFFSALLTERNGTPTVFKFEPAVKAGGPIRPKTVAPGSVNPADYQYVYRSADFKGGGNRRLESIKHHDFWLQNADKDTQNAFVSYTGSSYDTMNTELRRGGALGAKTKRIKEFFEKKQIPGLEQNTMIYRHSGLDAMKYGFGDEKYRQLAEDVFKGRTGALDDLKKSIIGSSYVDKGFQSTSYRVGVFAHQDEIEFRMMMPKGYNRGIFADIFSVFENEREYILKNGERFKVVDVEVGGVSLTTSDPNAKDIRNLIITVIPEDYAP